MRRRDVLKAGMATAVLGGLARAEEPAAARPNVLWLMTDEQRADSLGCYGAPWVHSPNLDRLAREGVVFTAAYTQAPVCTPARICMLTGQYCANSSVWQNIGRHELKFRFLTDIFRDAGYASATFGKQHYGGPRRAFDLERSLVISQAVDCYGYAEQYDERQYDVVKHPTGWVLGGTYPAPVEQAMEYRCVEEAKRWLEELEEGRPFLLRLSFSAPHTPVVPPPPFDTMIAEEDIKLPSEADPLPPDCAVWMRGRGASSDPLTPEQTRKMRRFYYGYCAFVDHEFGRLLDWMKERGLLDNTIVAFLSDHGTHLCDHGRVQKGTFYDPSARVPLFFWYPPAIAGPRVLHTPVETRSLLPTLLNLAGLPTPDYCADSSLAGALREGREPEARPVFSGMAFGFDPKHPDNRVVMVRDGDWKLTVCPDAPEVAGELVNLADDPHEQHNRYGAPEVSATQERLWGLVRGHLASTEKPFPNVQVLDALVINDAGETVCPLCRRTKIRRVDPTPDWSEGLRPAYVCGHCGTRFGMRADTDAGADG